MTDIRSEGHPDKCAGPGVCLHCDKRSTYAHRIKHCPLCTPGAKPRAIPPAVCPECKQEFTPKLHNKSVAQRTIYCGNPCAITARKRTMWTSFR